MDILKMVDQVCIPAGGSHYFRASNPTIMGTPCLKCRNTLSNISTDRFEDTSENFFTTVCSKCDIINEVSIKLREGKIVRLNLFSLFMITYKNTVINRYGEKSVSRTYYAFVHHNEWGNMSQDGLIKNAFVLSSPNIELRRFFSSESNQNDPFKKYELINIEPLTPYLSKKYNPFPFHPSYE